MCGQNIPVRVVDLNPGAMEFKMTYQGEEFTAFIVRRDERGLFVNIRGEGNLNSAIGTPYSEADFLRDWVGINEPVEPPDKSRYLWEADFMPEHWLGAGERAAIAFTEDRLPDYQEWQKQRGGKISKLVEVH